MTGIILSAGWGSRLGDITKDIPKCLLDISGKCSLGRILENFRYSNIKNIVIVTGYQTGKIGNYLNQKEFDDINICIVYNEKWEFTNNAYSLKLALDKINHLVNNDDIIVCNADVVCYKDLIKELVEFPKDNAMAVVRKKELVEEDMKVVVEDCKVIKVAKTLSATDSFGEFTGILKLSKKLVPFLREDLDMVLASNENAWFEHALVGLCAQKAICCKDVSHYPYIEIDFPEDLEEARDRFPYDQPVWEQGGRHQSLKENKRNLDDALALMVDFRDVLDKYKIRYWLNWGLLLGCIREGHPLQQDTDIDICIDKENEELFWEKVVPEMRNLRCFVPNREDHCDNDVFIIREGERIECNTMEKIQDHYIYSPERCKLSCPAKYLDQLRWFYVMGARFSIPSEVENFLKGWYGDWKTPANTKPKSF